MHIDRTRRTFAVAAGALALGGATVLSAAATGPRVVKVVAKKFVYVPGEIRVKRGDVVELRLTAPEVPMGFNLPDFGVRTDVVPGKVATLRFTADKVGSFTFLCDVFCGTGHEDMSGTLVVT
jgi:cytochrome c oxidase subunit 2